MFKKILRFSLVFLCVQQAVFETNSKQRKECLDAHNKYRKMHGVPPVKYDLKLEKHAVEWNDKIIKSGHYKHRPHPIYGENIYAGELSGNCARSLGSAVKAWYDSKSVYDFNKPKFDFVSGHFTQVVWKNSKRIGCAFAFYKNRVSAVVNYDPPGNYVGQFGKNVFKKVKT